MSRIDITLTRPQSKAFQILQQPTVDLNLEWGRGCGKSTFCRLVGWLWTAKADGKSRLELLEELGVADKLTPQQRKMAAKVKGIRIVFLMPTIKQFKDVHGSGIRSEVTDWGHLGPKPNWTDWKISFPGGSWIQPFPAADHSSQRSRGIRCDVVVADEADDIDPDVFDSIVRPWFSEPWSLKIRITCGTYKRGRHGLLYQRKMAGLDESQPRYHTIHATFADNPEIVDAAEVEDARRNTPKATFEREWLCNHDAGEGLVYVFDEEFHVRQAPKWDEFNEFIVGADHGDVDPAVLILFGIKGHGNDARVWALDEWYESEQLNSVWDERLALWDFATVYADPSRKDRLRDWRSQGRKVRDLPAEVKPIAAGIARVADLLHRRTHETFDDWCRFYVDPKCRNLIREFGLYRRKKHPDGTFSETPEDKNNHALDAARYALGGRFGRVPSYRQTLSGS